MGTPNWKIAEEIINLTMGNYAAWRIGLTHAPETKREWWQKRNYRINRWVQWELDDPDAAWTLYRYFTRNCGILRDRPIDIVPGKPLVLYIF